MIRAVDLVLILNVLFITSSRELSSNNFFEEKVRLGTGGELSWALKSLNTTKIRRQVPVVTDQILIYVNREHRFVHFTSVGYLQFVSLSVCLNSYYWVKG